MPLIKQKYIIRQNLKDNPDQIYLFGDNIQEWGYGGQAKEMRGEPNAIGIPTKMSPYEYFNDDRDFQLAMNRYTHIFINIRKLLDEGVIIVIPEKGIGTGLAKLGEKAPRIYSMLKDHLQNLDFPHQT